MDIVSPAKRSRMMSGIKGANTRPEMIIRSALHRKGFRYRLHVRKMPGKPDLVLARYNAVIFVNGCFWHGHDCHLFKWPKSREEFWKNKIESNRNRDELVMQQFKGSHWRVLTIWECALKGKQKLEHDALIEDVVTWLHSQKKILEIQGKPSLPE